MPPIYKQRPAYPALFAAIVSLLLGLFCCFMIYQRVQSGDIAPEKLVAMIMTSVSISGICLIAAFARYQFTHLWMKPHHKRRTRR